MNDKLCKKYDAFKKVFLKENSVCNLISKNDEKLLYEKHYFDSIAISLFLEKYNIKNAEILDIGCGGGFPSVPIALEYPSIKMTAVDSIRKKTISVERIKEALNIENLIVMCSRAENLQDKKYDIVISRAVAELGKISSYALPLLKNGGWFIAYKSRKAEEEIAAAEPVLKCSNAKVADIIDYQLPMDEIYDRKLICIKKN